MFKVCWGLFGVGALLGFLEDVQGGGVVEVKFMRYHDDCTDNLFQKCDPYFYFCLSKRVANPNPDSKCWYGKQGTSSHFHSEDDINFAQMSNIKGIPNPWITNVDNLERSFILWAKVYDHESWPFDNEHLRTWSMNFDLLTFASRSVSQWSSYTMRSSDHSLMFQARQYCNANYYTAACNVFCEPRGDEGGHYRCDSLTGNVVCLTGWTGSSCTEDIDECAEGVCFQGDCENLDGGFRCSCPQYYYGDQCESMEDACDPEPCVNGGLCHGNKDEFVFTCQCPEEWEGDTCDTRRDPCNTLPCLNSGVCLASEDKLDFTCNCVYPYIGVLCETEETTTTSTTTTTTTTTTTQSTTPTTTMPSTTTPTTTPLPPPTTATVPFTTLEASTASPINLSRLQGSNAGQEQTILKQEGSEFKLWYLVLLAAIMLLVATVFVLLFVRKRRKKKEHNMYFENPVVLNGNQSSYDNAIYLEANRSNMVIENRIIQCPVTCAPPLPPDNSCPVAPDDCCPVVTDDCCQGAVGGKDFYDNDDENTVVKRQKHISAEVNPYSDFETLKRESRYSRELSLEDKESEDDENDYQDLDEVIAEMQLPSDGMNEYANVACTTTNSHGAHPLNTERMRYDNPMHVTGDTHVTARVAGDTHVTARVTSNTHVTGDTHVTARVTSNTHVTGSATYDCPSPRHSFNQAIDTPPVIIFPYPTPNSSPTVHYDVPQHDFDSLYSVIPITQVLNGPGENLEESFDSHIGNSPELQPSQSQLYDNQSHPSPHTSEYVMASQVPRNSISFNQSAEEATEDTIQLSIEGSTEYNGYSMENPAFQSEA